MLATSLDENALRAPTELHPTETSPAAGKPSYWRFYAVGGVCLGFFLLLTMMLCAGAAQRLATPARDRAPAAGGGGGGAGEKVEVRDKPQGEAEKLVADFLMRYAEKPEDLRFLRWGPHLTRNDGRALYEKAGRLDLFEREQPPDPDAGVTPADVVVRLVYRASVRDLLSGEFETRELDLFFGVRGKEVHLGKPNHDGDEWKETWRKRTLARFKR